MLTWALVKIQIGNTKFRALALGVIIIMITAQEVESNLLGLPEEERTVAVSAMEKLNDTELVIVLKAFGVEVDPEQFTEQPAPQEVMPEESAIMPEEPVMEEPVMEEQVAAAPIDEQMQQLAPGGAPEVSDGTLKELAGVLNVPGKGNSGVDDDIESEMTGGDGKTSGSFVINKVAARYTGFNDIKQMLENAKRTAIELGFNEAENIDIGVIVGVKKSDNEADPTDTDVAVSNGEIPIPEVLAKVIGYDRLEKINKRNGAQEKTQEKLAEKQEPVVEQEVPVRAAPGGVLPKPKKKPPVPSNKQQVLDAVNLYFPSQEFPSALSAIMGNVAVESKYDNSAKQKGGTAIGLLQMQKAMRRDYEKFLMETEDLKLDDNADSQIKYLKEVLTSGRHIGTGTAKKVLDSLKLPRNKNNIITATKTLMGKPGVEGRLGFFNPGKPKADKRIAEALLYLAPAPTTSNIKRDIPMSEEELKRLEKTEEQRGGKVKKVLFDIFDSE